MMSVSEKNLSFDEPLLRTLQSWTDLATSPSPPGEVLYRAQIAFKMDFSLVLHVRNEETNSVALVKSEFIVLTSLSSCKSYAMSQKKSSIAAKQSRKVFWEVVVFQSQFYYLELNLPGYFLCCMTPVKLIALLLTSILLHVSIVSLKLC